MAIYKEISTIVEAACIVLAMIQTTTRACYMYLHKAHRHVLNWTLTKVGISPSRRRELLVTSAHREDVKTVVMRVSI